MSRFMGELSFKSHSLYEAIYMGLKKGLSMMSLNGPLDLKYLGELSEFSLQKANEVVFLGQQGVEYSVLRLAGDFSGHFILVFPQESLLSLLRALLKDDDLSFEDAETLQSRVVQEFAQVLLSSTLFCIQGVHKVSLRGSHFIQSLFKSRNGYTTPNHLVPDQNFLFDTSQLDLKTLYADFEFNFKETVIKGRFLLLLKRENLLFLSREDAAWEISKKLAKAKV